MKSLVIFVLIANLWIPSNCISINCNFTMINWVVVGNVYSCYQAKVIIPDEGRELQQVTGAHESSKNDANVEALHVSNTNCPFIPTKIEIFFTNLLVISFEQTNLKVLTSTDLQPFPMLKQFGSSYNFIESLDGDVFDYNIQLEYMSFFSNQLVNVGHFLFDKLTKLQIAYFNNNPCINFRASSPAAIAQLKQMLIDQCPPKATTTTSTTSAPTCGLVDEFLLCDAEFSYLIDSQVTERTNPLVLKVFGLDQQQIETLKQVNETQQQVTEHVVRFDEMEEEAINKEERMSKLEQELSGALKQIEDILRILEVQKKV